LGVYLVAASERQSPVTIPRWATWGLGHTHNKNKYAIIVNLYRKNKVFVNKLYVIRHIVNKIF